MSLSPLLLVVGLLVNISTASATLNNQYVISQLQPLTGELPTIQSDVDRQALALQVMAELDESNRRLRSKREECNKVTTVLNNSQFSTLNIEVDYYLPILSYFNYLNKYQCESEEFDDFSRRFAVSYVMLKDERRFDRLELMSLVPSLSYKEFMEADETFNTLPQSVKEAALKADFLKNNFNYVESLLPVLTFK
ncbi:hypothetical protein CKO50_22710 [Pseudoalteromonas sp. HM-SA03]|uniref:hypothetical protein n=1 Tax=Pseudoalteromonas sp. HM-SA03 TaxID=2029678 RepID=UPI000BAE097B|nr:hypothetical protein [Pseudoalteromonas sp. HM-SA03]PAX99079.1 hypothetical protein CKO50_22710 [Pseudoalteromonas sp. HM-SA03]